MQIMGGDIRYFWPENIGNFANLPYAWDSILNTGIGRSQINSLWITSYLNFTAFFNKLGLSWNLINFVFWILPAIILSFFSSFFLFNYLFKDKVKYSLLAGMIYTLNTYFLMILTGGQQGVALSYSLVPLVFLTFIRGIKNPTLKNSLLGGLVLGLQLLFDPRIVYITLMAVFIYLAFNFQKIKTLKNKHLLILPFGVTVLLNSFWILPLIITKNSPLPVGFESASGFKFFSFADFSHSFSLLHPNWPENIFGKVYFLRWEFLLLPIAAFSPLLFNKTRIILFFSFLALIGVFLAKGANAPLDFVNEFLFQHFPGMSMFRDPTKWYVLIALSYSVLIPFSIYQLSDWLKLKVKSQNYLAKLPLLLATCYLLILIRPIFLDQTSGIVKPKEVPAEYVVLKDFLVSQPEFFRTLWIPQWQRFGFFSNNHPAIGRDELFKSRSTEGRIEELKRNETRQLLQDLAVKYIIIPYDSEGEIFLDDRKYDYKQRVTTEKEIDKISWLKKIEVVDKIAVYETPSHRDRFFIADGGAFSEWKMVNPTKYLVSFKNINEPFKLVFSEGYDKLWQAKIGEKIIPSRPYHKILNSFSIDKTGDLEIIVEFMPQKYLDRGLLISGVTLLLTILSILIL